jgi:hypothetical protein
MYCICLRICSIRPHRFVWGRPLLPGNRRRLSAPQGRESMAEGRKPSVRERADGAASLEGATEARAPLSPLRGSRRFKRHSGRAPWSNRPAIRRIRPIGPTAPAGVQTVLLPHAEAEEVGNSKLTEEWHALSPRTAHSSQSSGARRRLLPTFRGISFAWSSRCQSARQCARTGPRPA